MTAPSPTQAPAGPAAIDQIRRAHKSARPKPSNPAWCNSHHDCGILLAAVEALRKLAIDDQSGESWRAIALKGEFQAGEVDRIANEYLRRAEAVEARCADLTGALEVAERALSNSPATYEHELPVIRATLADTPEMRQRGSNER